ncbi:Hsp70 family protein [Pedobacter changchengzhani]|uniref:Hsp70 family protein n=1 Tax=Pedobacter changchengzhani TaxID=2529274 RepID=A0A4R5MI81_9SPHI|nr:Hsp70 family protein [Pedobacter changchengzhani]TDG35026.1 Hsp70 family protein [Pedobacter changchengzhani]
MSTFLYGIDFGTTNSALSIFDEDKQEIIETISIPSLIYFKHVTNISDPYPYVIGENAIASYLEEGMKGRFIKSIKQILSRSTFTETRIQNRRYTASDLVTLIIKDLKEKADVITGVDCKKAVIGRPVFFDDESTQKDTLAQTRLKKAAENAGFTDLRFQFEPIGAAFAYEKTIVNRERVLVADLGGGTTDFTYLILDPKKVGTKDRQQDMIASGGIYIGGDSLDSAFMWDRGTPYFGKGIQYEATPGKVLTVPMSLFANICTWDKMNFFNGLRIKNDIEDYYYYSNNNPKFKNLITLIDHNLGYSLFRSIEETKILLPSANKAVFKYKNLDIKINEEISADGYNGIISKDILRIDEYLNRFMLENNFNADDVDCLFLTGGTSMVQAVQDLFKTKFPNTSINSGDNFKSVAKGLAYSGYLFD